jgi:hypothetical protein
MLILATDIEQMDRLAVQHLLLVLVAVVVAVILTANADMDGLVRLAQVALAVQVMLEYILLK